jgi:hypothetical protein
MTFTRPANHRQLTFEEIAKSAKITVNEVQFLNLGCPQQQSCVPTPGGGGGLCEHCAPSLSLQQQKQHHGGPGVSHKLCLT